MIEFKGQINLPNPNIGQTEKTITANESVRTCDTRSLAKEVAHASHDLVTEGIAELVINNFCKACVEKMVEGFAINMLNGEDVMMRIFPDIHLDTPTKNINLAKARELLDNPQLTEAEMVERAGELIDKVGVKVSVRAVVQQKFTDLLSKEGYKVTRTGIITATEQTASGSGQQGGSGEGGQQNGGGTDENGDNTE